MKLTDVSRFNDLAPEGRARQALELGAELKKKRRKPLAKGRLPHSVRPENLGIAGTILQSLHGIAGAVPQKVSGLREIGKLRIARKDVVDLVMTPQARKSQAQAALSRSARETVEDLAIRQLALAMLDKAPIPRSCAAYAYWQATGANHAVIPILTTGLDSKDENEFQVAAHCLAKIRPQLLSKFVRAEADDQPSRLEMPKAAEASMTVIIHGTFARDSEWYKPGGDFHEYIRTNVYPDVYSQSDYFKWSGSYTQRARNDAARELVQWCNAHPAQSLRLIGHSHGNMVVNIATTLGLQACTLIQLSPSVHKPHLPKIGNVSSDKFFTIRTTWDPAVWIDGGMPDYRDTEVARYEKRKKISTWGHSETHYPKYWEKDSLRSFIFREGVCLP